VGGVFVPDGTSDDVDLRPSMDLDTEERRVSSEGSWGVVDGVGVDGREPDIARMDDVRRMTPPMRDRKDLLGVPGVPGLLIVLLGYQIEE
jgi:hypothetical protein